MPGVQFWSAKEIKRFARNRAEQTLRISPVLISEGVTSIRETVRTSLGVAVLPDWLIREDLLAGQLVRVLPQWNCERPTGSRRLCRRSTVADSRARLHRLRRQLPDKGVGLMRLTNARSER